MERTIYDRSGKGLSRSEITDSIFASLEGRAHKNVLLIPPDFTRYPSNAGFITNTYYHALRRMGAEVDILPALGTHEPVSIDESRIMFGDIPYKKLIPHNWRTDVEKIGSVPAEYLSAITEGLWNNAIDVEINKLVMCSRYDLIISIGQVVPHEVIGMANHAKNLFVGVGGSDMINKTHMVGAIYGMERMMGKDHSPVRKIFDYALDHFLKERPIIFVLTVTTMPADEILTHGLFIGDTRKVLERAIELAQEKNIDFVMTGLKKCVVYLDPAEFKSTWLGNKAIYRTRMAMANGGELIVLAPGIRRFGEDAQCDALIRKYGYCGRRRVLELFNKNDDLQANMSAAAHLIHGSSDGCFNITYAVKKISKQEIENVGYKAVDYDSLVCTIPQKKLIYGRNVLDDGDEIFFIPNPALGLWIDKSRF